MKMENYEEVKVKLKAIQLKQVKICNRKHD